MKRYEILQEITSLLKDQIVICNIGIPSKELYEIKDRSRNFYMLGSMGLASSISLGVALAKPDNQIWCIEGDGALLMNLGSLSTIANQNPKNLTVIAIDNHAYGSTGSQETHTKYKTRLDMIASGAGFESVYKVKTKEEIKSTLSKLGGGCHFVLIESEPGNQKLKPIPLKSKEIKKRFMNAING